MSTPYGPDQPPPSGPPAQPGPYGPTGPLPPPVDPFTQTGQPPTPDPGSPAPTGQPGSYGPPQSTPPNPYGPPPSAPPNPYGQHSAPPNPYGPSAPYSAPPTVSWPGEPGQPSSAGSRNGRTVALMVGVSLPLFVIIVVVVGLLVMPRVLDNLQGGPATPSTPAVDPLALPAVGSCFDFRPGTRPFTSDAERARLVPCNEAHTVETIAVGELADVVRPPDESSGQARELYAQCEQAAQEYLGVAWRSTYTWLVLSVPSSSAWTAGARWYRCDLTANDGFYQQRPTRIVGPLRELVEPITCLTWVVEDSLTRIEPSDCDEEHQGELAGVYPVPKEADYSDPEALTDLFDEKCVPIVLDYLEVDRLPNELSYWYAWPNEDDLDQWVACLVAADEDNRSFVGSLRGIGSGSIPFA